MVLKIALYMCIIKLFILLAGLFDILCLGYQFIFRNLLNGTIMLPYYSIYTYI